ncbi:benzyl alcohol O-benzoyltransferase-like [Miscanthus floridulus]|uniref:benzyl alcohol O-benzoyltransferase-like n=1 Tax=Miscanthus floridulus TaxID=154761 RepID=UPI00345A8733
MKLDFAVRRREPELVGPARQTPRETKRLSDIEDQVGLRWHVPFVLFYRGRGDAAGNDDPAALVRRALGEALVPYFPLAGRLREVEGRKLVVDCTGEGVVFVEADADVRLAELVAAGLRPPFPCMDQLLFDVEGSGGVLNSPLLLIQVTRLRCGGFVFALRLNHTMCDSADIVQFMRAVGELARGLPEPTVAPVWSREILDARSPPRPSFPHHEYDPVPPPPPSCPPPGDDMVMRTFIFGPDHVAAIKKGLSAQWGSSKATTFEALAAFIWRARTAALEIPADEDARLVIAASVRGVRDLELPAGYYGNACVYPAAVATAGSLRGGSGTPGDAVELVREVTRSAVSAEYVRSTADLMALRERPSLATANTLIVSDNRHAGFRHVDFGWGEPVYGGPAGALFVLSFIVAVTNGNGEDSIAVPIALPRSAMDRFASEVKMLC